MTLKEDNEVKSQRIITTPFADDFNLLTGHKIRHQKLQDDIQIQTNYMGLTLQPIKCRILSICAGKPSKVDFTLAKNPNQTNSQKGQNIKSQPTTGT